MTKTTQKRLAILACKLFTIGIFVFCIVVFSNIVAMGDDDVHENIVELSPTFRWIIGMLFVAVLNAAIFILRHELEISKLKNRQPKVLQVACDKTVDHIYAELDHGKERFARMEKSMAQIEATSADGFKEVLKALEKINR